MDDSIAKRQAEQPDALLSGESASIARLVRLRAACEKNGIDAFFVRDLSNIRWLTSFDNVFDDEDAHALLIASQEAVLHTDSRYAEAARRAARAMFGASGENGAHAADTEKTPAPVAPLSVDDTRQSHAAWAMRLLSGKESILGIENTMALGEYRVLEATKAKEAAHLHLRETENFVRGLRAVKDHLEVARLKAAQAITDAAFSHIVDFIRPGLTERDVKIELEDFMRRRGAAGLAFPSIVATGAHGASPHAIPGDTSLEVGQCVVLDFGARAQGYCSDMTRTVFLGEPSATMRNAYDTIRLANEQVQAALKPGVTGAAMQEMAERILVEGGFEGAMGHGLGHGVGIDIHEEPALSGRNATALVEGNVVTVEPGIYLPGEFGMRLEDFGILTRDGFAVFTQSTHEMVII